MGEFKHVREVLAEVVGGRFHQRLKDLGYRRSGHTWRLLEPTRVRIVNVQGSSFGNQESGSFTINLASFDYAAQNKLYGLQPDWPKPKGKLPVHWNCLIQTRIGRLMKLPKKQVDYWWQISRETPIEGLENELLKILEQCAFPWLERVGDLKYAEANSEFGRNPWLTEIIASFANEAAQGT